MNIADSTALSIGELVREANQHLCLDNVDSTAIAEERAAAATLVDSILDQLVSLGNTEYLGSFIFAGRNNTTAPFVRENNNVQFTGDLQPLTVEIAPEMSEEFSLTADQVFGTGRQKLAGYRDLAPAANADTRLTDLQGAIDQGIRLGTVVITGSVIGEVRVDLTGCERLGDVIDKINDTLPASVQVSLDPGGRQLVLTSTNPGETLVVTESGQGTVAHDLGLCPAVGPATPQASPVTYNDFGVRLTLQTPITALNQGTGIDLAGGIIITNGANSISLDFSTATTVQDILNTINASGIGVRAQSNADQTGIELVNLVAGARLTVGENGGTTADDLGLRTFRGETRLADLNDGLGVSTGDGNDFDITTSSGTVVGVDIDGAATIQDVLDRINAAAGAAGVNLTAALAGTGNGIVLTDNTGGAGTFRVERAENLANAAKDLGLLQEAATGSNVITGEDVNPFKDESIFTYLIDLRDGLKNNDTRAIEQASQNILAYQGHLEQYQGKLGFMTKGLELRQTQTETAVLSTKTLLSNIKDLDYTEAITRFQNLQTTLQANLQTGGQILNTSLLDYLG